MNNGTPSHPRTDNELGMTAIEENQSRRVVGTPEQVCEKLELFVKKFKLDELMILTITHNAAARRNSYELLNAAW